MASITEFTEVLGRKNAAHLLRRCTFGPTIADIDTYSTLTAAQALTTLFTDQTLPAPPIDTATGSSWVNPPTQNKAVEGANSEQDTLFDYFKAWHTDVMRKSGLSIKERITWFYHTHLPVAWTKVGTTEAIYYQNCLFRHYAFGSFKELFKKICIDNAMLIYIDGTLNHKDSPNENFGREMFELYSIGKGPQLENGNYTNYTEDDIKAAARVLTGWTADEDYITLDADSTIPIGKMVSSTAGNGTTKLAISHTPGTKTFSSLFDNTAITTNEMVDDLPTVDAAVQELDDMIEMIFGKIETARYVTRKLYRFFVYHFITEEVETDIIQPLAQILYDNNYEIQEMLKVLFKSQHFYDADDAVSGNNNIGAVIKSPVDLVLGLLRFFEVEIPDRNSQTAGFYNDVIQGILPMFSDQGLTYYDPFDVAGYDPYFQVPGFARNWIMSIELAHRYQIGEIFMKRTGDMGSFSFKLDALDWIRNSGYISDPTDPEELTDVLINNMLAVELTTERRNYFLNTVFLDTFTATTWQYEWDNYINGGDDTVVRNRIETLVSALIQTPEYQLI